MVNYTCIGPTCARAAPLRRKDTPFPCQHKLNLLSSNLFATSRPAPLARNNHCALRITHYALRITHCALRRTHYALLIAHYALYCSLRIINNSRIDFFTLLSKFSRSIARDFNRITVRINSIERITEDLRDGNSPLCSIAPKARIRKSVLRTSPGARCIRESGRKRELTCATKVKWLQEGIVDTS